MKEYLESTGAVLTKLGSTNERGLSSAEASKRLAELGPNKLKEAKKIPLWIRFFQQMADPMVIMLIVAAAISAVAGAIQGEMDFADIIIIMLVVVINSVLGVVQEAKSEEALAALQEMSAARSKVVRDAKTELLHSSELVPGDVVLLEAGDSVPADCRVLESASMKIEEAALTGESVPVEKHADTIALAADEDDVALGDRKNMCYMGSTVVYGRGRVVVCGTAMDTEMGRIAGALAQAKEELTPLQVKLAELSKILTVMVIAICAVIFAVDFVRHGAEMLAQPELILDTFMVAVSLAVAAIPEGLVAVVTIVLSLGVTKMAKRQAIIRKLSAVETLGCTQVICSDKTGTLTQNKMTVVEHASEDLEELLRAMALCSDAEWDVDKGSAIGEPTEAALVADAAKQDLLKTDLDTEFHRIGEAPFDSGRKMMSVVCESPSGEIIQYTKGAPDEILKRCTKVRRADGVVDLTDEMRQTLLAQNKALADKALRVLACSERSWDASPASYDTAFLEQDLTYLGLSGMIDPVRPQVGPAIKEAHDAGIRVVMITGDHIDTAVAIAKELDIISDRSQAITGVELDKMSDEELDSAIEGYGVYARVQPQHKTRIVEAWKSRGKVVAMTGDGVNDAPSIKRADIGVGMGITGTDVTKNVADMVLADDNFATIIGACEEGRCIYDNIRKVIQFLLSANLAEVFAVFTATLIGFTIFQPVQLLWINLVTDSFPALALGMEDAEGDLMRRKPRDSKDGVFAGGMGLDCIVQGVIITVLVLASFFVGVYFDLGYIDIAQMVAGTADEEGATMAFITLSMVEIFHCFNMRSRRASIFHMRRQNVALWGAALLALFLTIVVVEFAPLAKMFGFMVLPSEGLIWALFLAFLIIPLIELYKAIMRAWESNDA